MAISCVLCRNKSDYISFVIDNVNYVIIENYILVFLVMKNHRFLVLSQSTKHIDNG